MHAASIVALLLVALTLDVHATTVSFKEMEQGGQTTPPPAPKPFTDHGYQVAYTELKTKGDKCQVSIPGSIPMCATANYMCRLPDKQPMASFPAECLPYNASAPGIPKLDVTGVKPWGVCDATTTALQCQRQFQCRCRSGTMSDSAKQGGGSACYCVPPDAVVESILTTTCQKTTCETGEYCRWSGPGAAKCAPKPYAQ